MPTALVLHAEHPPASGLAACCALPLGTTDPPERYPVVPCADCAAALARPLCDRPGCFGELMVPVPGLELAECPRCGAMADREQAA